MTDKKRRSNEKEPIAQDPIAFDASDRAGSQAPPKDSQKSDVSAAKPLRIKKTFRVPPTGDVFLTELEAKIVDTPDFQRLRRIRQLGTVCFVFPCALHTRFDHSLGVLRMADLMIQAIRTNSHNADRERAIDETQEILTRIYALLHDITHVPFGHTIEDELGVFPRHDENDARIDRFLGPDSSIAALIRDELGQGAYERFMSIYRWHGGKYENEEDKTKRRHLINVDDAFVYDLVSNTVCADLLDYIRRDSYFCGLNVELEYRFINYLYLKDHDGKRRVFVRLWKDAKPTPRQDTLTDLVRLLQARYLIAERAYFHHAKIVTGAMLGRAVQDAKDVGDITEAALYELGDDTLLDRLQRSKSPTAARLATALLNREIHKILVPYHESDLQNRQEHDPSHDTFGHVLQYHKSASSRRELENSIVNQIGARQGDVLLYVPDRMMNLKAAEMLVWWNGKVEKLQDINDRSTAPRLRQILSDHKNLWGAYVIVSRDLSPEQENLVRGFFNIEFTVPSTRTKPARQHYNEELIRLKLARDGFTIRESTAKDFDAALRRTAEALEAVAHDPEFPERLQTVMQLHLRDVVVGPEKGDEGKGDQE